MGEELSRFDTTNPADDIGMESMDDSCSVLAHLTMVRSAFDSVTGGEGLGCRQITQ